MQTVEGEKAIELRKCFVKISNVRKGMAKSLFAAQICVASKHN